MNRKALLIDITKCVGCGECERACNAANGLKDEDQESLSSAHYTFVADIDGTYVRKLCMHCNTPTCVSACLVGAFEKKDTGAVLYDETKCIGCRYCMQACPFGIPQYEWNELVPRVQKCKFCYERVKDGKQTACAEACPAEATVFGDRDTLIEEARKRIRENSDSYINHIYGITEAGGTSVMYISAIPFDKLGFPTERMPHEPIPDISWRVLSQIPKYSVAAGVVLYGIHWITQRRKEVAEYEERQKHEN